MRLLSLLIFSFLLLFPNIAFAENTIVKVRIEGPIHLAKHSLLKNAVKKSVEENAKLLLIELDTPGGVLSVTKDMVGEILDAPVPTAVYVGPSGSGAISAGTFIALSANKVLMAPATTIGAAHPVNSDGSDIDGDMKEKVENYASSLLKSIVEARGRDAAWAEQAVKSNATLTVAEALEKGVIDFRAPFFESVLEQLEGQTVKVGEKEVVLAGLKDAKIINVEMSTLEYLQSSLSDPSLVAIFSLVALAGIMIELASPGLAVPGVVGFICLVLSLIGGSVLPVHEGALLLLAVGTVFMAIELFAPSYALWGMASIACWVFGLLYLVDNEMIWSAGGFLLDVSYVLGSLTFLLVAIILGVIVIIRRNDPYRKFRAQLVGTKAEVTKVFTGAQQGKLHTYGKVLVFEKELAAQFELAEGASIEPGAMVEITDADPNRRVCVAKPA